MLEALPDLGLPQAVEALDGRLEAGFPWWGEDRHHAFDEAEADQSAQAAHRTGGARETGVIVHLQIGGPTLSPPMGLQRGGDRGYAPAAGRRFRQGEFAPEGNGVEHLHCTPPAQLQSLHHIQLIQLGPTGRNPRQIPADRRGRLPLALLGQHATTPQDPGDGAGTGRILTLPQQMIPDGLRSDVAERVMQPQPTAQGDNAPLQTAGGAVCRLCRAARPIRPVDPVQSPTTGALDPEAHRADRATKLTRGGP